MTILNNQKIVLCMGTRPEIIKMAPVYHELKKRGQQPVLVHTGQHQEMADPLYEFFDILPDVTLDLKRTSNGLHHLSALLLDKLGTAFETILPTTVLVHGDTSSAAMAALAAFYHKIPVGHVEAGLRSYHNYDPFPEEMNRTMIARLAHWHFAPTTVARSNLLAEGITDTTIHMVGNTVVDAVRLAGSEFHDEVEHMERLEKSRLRRLPEMLASRRLILVTAHRRENLGRPLQSIAQAVRHLVQDDPDVTIVWPVHSNPSVRATVHEAFTALPEAIAERVLLTEPLDYATTLWLLRQAWLVMTDSGGLQEESMCVRTPVLVLRDTTERPELIATGGGLLVGTDSSRIINTVQNLVNDRAAHAAMKATPNPFGDGHAAEKICDVVTHAAQDHRSEPQLETI